MKGQLLTEYSKTANIFFFIQKKINLRSVTNKVGDIENMWEEVLWSDETRGILATSQKYLCSRNIKIVHHSQI